MVLGDVSYPETPVILEDLHLIGNQSVQHFREAAKRRVRSGFSEAQQNAGARMIIKCRNIKG